MSHSHDAIILGAGAAGLMCALTAAQRGRRVALVDHAEAVGKKILISGGGRCNFTNLETVPERFLSANRHFHKSALSRYTQADFIAMVERHRISYHEKTLGQLFCDDSAKRIVRMLLDECQGGPGSVDIRLAHRVTDVAHADAAFRVTTEKGSLSAPALVVATGGPSIPKMGATGFAYDVARRFGLKIVEPRPALVPLTAGPEDLALMRPLSGVSLDAVAACGKTAFRENILFTHRGLSGPAILQISSYWAPGGAITLDLLPGTDATAFLLDRKASRPKAGMKSVLSEVLPSRLAQALAEGSFPGDAMASMPDKALRKAGEALNRWRFVPAGTEGFAKAEVTAGGVDTRALSSQTMEARAVPGLFFIGEAVDVTGWLGGYNFQWAWSSGWSAGQAL
ncbi:NAD(P)/FAD-dependent oxidoreductase [Caenispirillum salinarum]|uniref:NAD(P)/FAD-dependent oxidoreductase n=1 Tax=Caenispirillum salinarum TaxID=859058 RepID=UPI00384E64B4